MELFHGSNVIVDKPLVNVGRQELDFGPGFYITQYKDQAIGQLKFAKPSHQVCISNQEIIEKCLFFESAELIK